MTDEGVRLKEVYLREIGPTHDAVLTALHEASFSSPWPQNAFTDLLALPTVFGWIAENTTPQGFILMQSAADETEILTLAVVPEERRRGLGRHLVRHALDCARTNGIGVCHLEVAANNAAALALYAQLGFTPSGQRPAYYRQASGVQDAVIMRCLL